LALSSTLLTADREPEFELTLGTLLPEIEGLQPWVVTPAVQ